LLPSAGLLTPALAAAGATPGTGSATAWRSCTPAMAAGRDRAGLEPASSPARSGAARATARGGLHKPWWWAATQEGGAEAGTGARTAAGGHQSGAAGRGDVLRA